MNSDPENFEPLRRLLALKRHEQPPPGYFRDLSGRVLARIEAGDSGQSEGSWLQRFWAALEGKPIVAGAFGVAICAMLITGIMNSDQTVIQQGSDPVIVQTYPAMSRRAPWESAQPVSATNRLGDLFDHVQFNAEPATMT